MFKGTPRQFIFYNDLTNEILVYGYFAAEKLSEYKLKYLTFIGEV